MIMDAAKNIADGSQAARAMETVRAVSSVPRKSAYPAAGHSAVRESRLISGTGLFFIFCAILVLLAWKLPLERYLTPRSGAGYALGIIGGSLMLALLLYPVRKRFRVLSFMGSVKGWFQAHMVMGLVGPICILYHCNFSLGAVNSNIALVCMLVVSWSGIAGRYFYTRIHEGLSDRVTSLNELQANADRLKHVSLSVPFLPELLQRLAGEEQRLLARVSRRPVMLRPLFAAVDGFFAMRRLTDYARKSLWDAAKQSPVLATQRGRLLRTTRRYVGDRLRATKRVADYQAYTRLFSLWHVLHLPLFFLLLLAGIAHVVAVHVY